MRSAPTPAPTHSSSPSFAFAGRARPRLATLAAFAAVATLVTSLLPRAEVRADEPVPPVPLAREADAGISSALVSPPHLEDVEHMCALLTGCDKLPLPPGLVPRDFATCVQTLYGELTSSAAVTFSLTLRECGLRASSCGELRSCALRGAKPEVCAGRGKQGPVDVCDGAGRAVTCVDERISTVRDCPRGGEQCAIRDGKASCTLGPCEADAPASCSPSGTRILECKKGKLVSLDCAAFGLKCVASTNGPRCATSAAACVPGPPRCEGNVAIGCHEGHEVRVDCGATGLVCGGSGASIGICTSPPSAASQSGARDGGAEACTSTGSKCDGATIRWCAWGKPRSYLCKSMGLSRCVADDKGARCGG